MATRKTCDTCDGLITVNAYYFRVDVLLADGREMECDECREDFNKRLTDWAKEPLKYRSFRATRHTASANERVSDEY